MAYVAKKISTRARKFYSNRTTKNFSKKFKKEVVHNGKSFILFYHSDKNNQWCPDILVGTVNEDGTFTRNRADARVTSRVSGRPTGLIDPVAVFEDYLDRKDWELARYGE